MKRKKVVCECVTVNGMHKYAVGIEKYLKNIIVLPVNSMTSCSVSLLFRIDDKKESLRKIKT